ncbi:DNA (cytosine-5)-methyltransferase PliMCI-like isoform X2 [Pectinophora gossypiella]|uniref:DNA (cytosine-5)-methyltransferase PliMCI-like isoform X2 n=1 Tax=Pectinophora gossypiella TaxID=13191 RepID=UPI00214F0C40|nr:DNA (cytosine-5)-methyltransferase PliMCI-like isoform X2 [Pectinophora gossypiella]
MPASMRNGSISSQSWNKSSTSWDDEVTPEESNLPDKKTSKALSRKGRQRLSQNGTSKQLTITNMFPVKRSRSSENIEEKKVKIDANIEAVEQKHNNNDTIENKESDTSTDDVTNNCNNNHVFNSSCVDEVEIQNLDNNNKSENSSQDVCNKSLESSDDKTENGYHKEISEHFESSDTVKIGSEDNLVEDVNKSNVGHKDKANNEVSDLNSNQTIKSNIPDNEQCNICGQFINNSDIIYYQGHPQDAVEEFIALTNEKLVLSAGDEGDIMERPQTNITGFSIFDQHGHLCPIDGGLVENDVRIYMSGYLKSICSDSSDIDEDSIPVKDVGPIIEWFIHGFDGGDRNCITLSTEFGEYNLLKPSTEYTPLMNNLYEKIWLSKVVVEYLEEFHYLQPNYEDLLEVVREAKIPELDDKKMTEEMLHKHAQFVCDQVVSLETNEDDDPLITLPCMRELIKLMGIKFGKRKIRAKIDYKKVDKKSWTKATTTPLVRKTFESFFTNQLDKTNHELVLRRKRCGICEACQLPDCGECNACRAMAKFGGHGRTKKACVRRLCPNMAVQQAEDSEPEDEDDYQIMVEKKIQDKLEDTVPVKLTGVNSRNIKWIGEPVKADSTKIYYEKVEIDGAELQIGDYVMVETSQPNIPALVARVVYMWKETFNLKAGYFHGEVFIRSSETVLGEVGDPREVFLGDKCCHAAPLSSILRKAIVEKKEISKDWFKLGGKEVDDDTFEDDGKTYFYNKYYERFTARFEDLPENPVCPNEMRKHRYCPSCERKTKRDAKNIPKVVEKLVEKSDNVKEANRTEWSLVKWQDYDYKKGCGVFLKPGTFKLKNSLNNSNNITKVKLEKVDEDVYPEYYRKSDSNLRGSNVDTGEPFCLGYIAAITAAGDGPLIVPQDIYIKVNVLYRPENTFSRFPQHEDLNVVYWSDEIVEVPFSTVVGPCSLTYEKNIPEQDSIHEWLEKDPSRFYFRMAYDKSRGEFVDVPHHASSIGRTDKGKDKGKGKGKSSKPQQEQQNTKVEEIKIRPLRTLDVFAGCGGLSDGLHQAGIAECRWAIENLEAAAHAYSLNNKNCTVFNEDCNALLKDAMSGASHSAGGLRLPMQGEVELLCGGPPCQGFSGMNRFNSREYSNFKNSLVASYLSFCDYYRPKYFILENVRNFVAFKKGMVLKLTLRTLLDMGYQCTFGILQAGNYGVPQTRRRLIILAAAPGYKLPLYPEPTHVFSRRACSLTATIDGKRFVTNSQWDESAPRRTCTIHDAMSDLPEICNGANKLEIDYGSMPESHFQRMIRSKDESTKLRDHICKNMAPLIQARICRVPTTPGSDWRDLPNISVTLSDGTKCKVLQYRYDDKKNGRSSSGALRGVCACAAGGTCSSNDKQENTLIPWCLPHTGNRHNNWAGLYGRVSWDGYFSTTVTDPEPMGKQGRVLHPEQNRVVSVRECARSQGFRDTYIFAGSIQDKHRQIGNAVPPPLGAALGREIKKAFIKSTPT